VTTRAVRRNIAKKAAVSRRSVQAKSYVEQKRMLERNEP
jgi:hypothetical protein